MTIEVDMETTTEAGFNKYLVRLNYGTNESASITTTHVDPNTFAGGIIGSEGVMYLGSKQIRLDGKNRRIVISDGVNDRIVIGGF